MVVLFKLFGLETLVRKYMTYPEHQRKRKTQGNLHKIAPCFSKSASTLLLRPKQVVIPTRYHPVREHLSQV